MAMQGRCRCRCRFRRKGWKCSNDDKTVVIETVGEGSFELAGRLEEGKKEERC